MPRPMRLRTIAYADVESASPHSTPRYPVHSVLEAIAAGAGETSARC